MHSEVMIVMSWVEEKVYKQGHTNYLKIRAVLTIQDCRNYRMKLT